MRSTLSIGFHGDLCSLIYGQAALKYHLGPELPLIPRRNVSLNGHV